MLSQPASQPHEVERCLLWMGMALGQDPGKAAWLAYL